MIFTRNYITVDGEITAKLPIELQLLLLYPSEIKRHREQILNCRIAIFDLKFNRSGTRSLHIDEITNRVFFYKRANKLASNNIYYLDELIKSK